MRARQPSPDLGSRLNDLARRYDKGWLESDPLRWPRRYRDPRDRELVAVVAALLAYGRVASIHRSIAAVLDRLPARPSDALAPSHRGDLGARLRGFRHRFTAGEDLAWLLESVARAWDEAGSLGAYVEAAADGDEPLRAGLAAWHVWIQGQPKGAVPACGMGLNYMLETMPLTDVLSKVFKGSGECAEVGWNFLGLAIPSWTLVFFVAMMVAAITLARRD